MAASISRHFHRADGRADFERARREFSGLLQDGGAGANAARLVELGAVLDTGVARIKGELLASALCANDDNHAAIAWICRQHRALAEAGARVCEAMRLQPKVDVALGERVAAMTLHHWAEAVKWAPARERADYSPVHDAMRHAIARGRQCAALNCIADGRGRATTLEALYFRALLLDRFATGSLTRTQLELLDAWLWEWSGALHGFAKAPGGAVLRADLDSNGGLREGPRDAPGESLYLPLAPLERRRREVISSLHQGRVVPQHGCASDFRVEEHVALLDHLQAAFRPGAEQRAPRRNVAGTKVEVWVGLQEILARGVGVGIETGRFAAMNTGARTFDEQARARFSDATRRYLWLSDQSATGLGFQATGTDAQGIGIGDLLGWRWTLGGPVILGVVMRLMPAAGGGPLAIGVKVLTEAAQPLPLTQLVDFDNPNVNGTYLFLPGEDASGTGDAFLLPDNSFELRSTYRTHAGGNGYTLRFNRVRARGRGWLAAGFEMLPARAEAPQPDRDDSALPLLEFSYLEESRDGEDAWDRDLTSRLRS